MNHWATLSAKIRAGKTVEVRAALEAMEIDFPRSDTLPFANLCRRAGLPKLGLQALRPWVRPAEKKPQVARDEEKVEYAACLHWLGLKNEAELLLRSINTSAAPEAWLIGAFLDFSRWDYASGSQKLSRYLNGNCGDYERLVAQVNLLSAHVHLRETAAAEKLLAELKPALSSPSLANLRLNAQKQELELAVDQRDWRRVDTLRGNASLTEDPYSQLFLRKWLAIAALARDPGSNSLEEVRRQARALAHFETLRECDYHEAVQTKNIELATKVYFGTPLPHYRERLLLDAPWLRERLPTSIEIRRRGELSCRAGSAPLPLKPESLLSRLFYVLVQDFYQPPTIYQIFSGLFPSGHFTDAQTNLVHQALFRLRKALPELTILEQDGRYIVEGKIWVSAVASPPRGENIKPRFNCLELANELGLVPRSAQRMIKEWLNEGKIVKERSGKNIFYRRVS